MPAADSGHNGTRARLTAQQRKEMIVQTVLDLAAEHGPSAVTTELIASRVGVTQPAIFRHFPKKEMIWTAVGETLGQRMAAVWKQIPQANVAPHRRLRQIALAQLTFIRDTPGLTAILFSRELHMGNDELRIALAGRQDALFAILVAAVDDAKKAGTFRPDLVSADAVFLVIALIQSLALRWSLSGYRIDLVRTGEPLIDTLIQGFVSQT